MHSLNNSSSVALHERGVRLYEVYVQNHDDLWFSSVEISRHSVTRAFIHNYALTYALGQRHIAIADGNTPYYVRDPEGEFGSIGLYTTPAEAPGAQLVTRTANALDDPSASTGKAKQANIPTFWRTTTVAPQYDVLDTSATPVGFRAYVFTFHDTAIPGVIGLGKKRAWCRVRRVELVNPIARWSDVPFQPTHIVNPLDVTGLIERSIPITIPPHVIHRQCLIRRDWVVQLAEHCVHVPARVQARAQLDDARGEVP